MTSTSAEHAEVVFQTPLRSSAVSFPSLPSLLVKSGLEPEEDWLLVVLDEPEELAELEGFPVLDFS